MQQDVRINRQPSITMCNWHAIYRAIFRSKSRLVFGFQAKCCSDGKHCCEYGYTCDSTSMSCRNLYSQVPSARKESAKQGWRHPVKNSCRRFYIFGLMRSPLRAVWEFLQIVLAWCLHDWQVFCACKGLCLLFILLTNSFFSRASIHSSTFIFHIT